MSSAQKLTALLQINFIYAQIDGKLQKYNSLNRAHPCLFCHCHGSEADISAYQYQYI